LLRGPAEVSSCHAVDSSTLIMFLPPDRSAPPAEVPTVGELQPHMARGQIDRLYAGQSLSPLKTLSRYCWQA
jgi:hypothetical protein